MAARQGRRATGDRPQPRAAARRQGDRRLLRLGRRRQDDDRGRGRAPMAAVHLGGKVLVLTVDPARRLANALGLERFGNVETRVPPTAFAAAGVEPRGELWAAMLDTKQSWDDLVRRHAPDAATRDAILDNPLYQNITGRFVQSHDYIAMERLLRDPRRRARTT